MIHTVKDFGIVNEAEVNVFLDLELPCFSDDPTHVANLNSIQYVIVLSCNMIGSEDRMWTYLENHYSVCYSCLVPFC